MDADGKNPRGFSASVDFVDQWPAWSPDGQVIVFTQMRELGGVPYLMAAPMYEGSDYREYRIDPNPVPMKEADYSPDGIWLVFESWPEGSNHDIYIMTATGANRRRLTIETSREFDASWGP
jgi:hypothetical protein